MTAASGGLDIGRVSLKYRRTKIVATVGPASSSPEALRKLIAAGVNVFRLNFSHGSHESHAAVFHAIRAAQAELGAQVAVLADLCGPKIRVGKFEGGAIQVETGSDVTVTVRKGVLGVPGLIPSEYEALAKDARVGDRVLLDDGKLELRVQAILGNELTCHVVHGGRLSDKKGMNLPGVQVSAPALTEKDKSDAAFAAKLGVDYVALSFVRAAQDVRELRQLLDSWGTPLPIISKIEKPEAIDCIGEILEVSDAIMIARGDLGIEMPAEEVPLLQQELIRVCIAANRPVIVATQMLESMIEQPRPTRAEVTDVAAAALAGADAVMLSGETASGRHPVEAVETMDRVLRRVEGWQWRHSQFGRNRAHVNHGGHATALVLSEALSRATSQLSRDLQVRAIVVPTSSGRTAALVSSERPAAPILAVAASGKVCRKLALFWGIHALQRDDALPQHQPALAREVAAELGLAKPGQFILLVWDAGGQGGGDAPTVTILGG